MSLVFTRLSLRSMVGSSYCLFTWEERASRRPMLSEKREVTWVIIKRTLMFSVTRMVKILST